MKKLLLSLPLIFAQGCVNTPGSLEGYCVASAAATASHAAALADTPDETALRTGDLMIRQRAAVCK